MVSPKLSHQQYEWHQSHDQATVLLLIEHGQDFDTPDVEVIIEPGFIQAGIRGEHPIIKGRLYGDVDPKTSVWNLGNAPGGRPIRERTTSSTSTSSAHSSFAFVSEPDISISQSFEASLANSTRDSDAEDAANESAGEGLAPPGTHSAGGGHGGHGGHGGGGGGRRIQHLSPRSYQASLLSSLESLHSLRAPRLLMTIHLHKAEAGIWPTLITSARDSPSSGSLESSLVADKYDMDTTSLSGLGLHLLDIQKDKDEAFEHFIRAWQRGRTPLAAVKLVYAFFNPLLTPGTTDPLEGVQNSGEAAYQLERVGGKSGLAQLYLEAGLLHLDGTASQLMSTSPALSSIKLPSRYHPGARTNNDRWHEDRDIAMRYFDHARALDPNLEVPMLVEAEKGADWQIGDEFMMPSMDLGHPPTQPPTQPESRASSAMGSYASLPPGRAPTRRRKPSTPLRKGKGSRDADGSGEDSTWYLFLPAAVGAGTALLVIGLVSLQTWRKADA